MRTLAKLDYKLLYLLWAVLFAVTAVLGFLFPSVEGAAKLPLLLIAGAFFLPPWAVLAKARQEQQKRHILTLRWLSLTSVALTTVLLVLNILSAGMGETVGSILNIVLTIVSAPMICSNLYIMPLFLWGSLLMATFSRN